MKKKGFTLLEIITVVVIIGILVAILVPTTMGYINKAKKKATVANAKILWTEVNNIVIWNDDCYDSFYLSTGSKWCFQSNSVGECKRMAVSENSRVSNGDYVLSVVCRADGRDHALGSGVGDDPPDRIFNTWNDCDDRKNNHATYIIKLCESENIIPFEQNGIVFPLEMPFSKREDGKKQPLVDGLFVIELTILKK